MSAVRRPVRRNDELATRRDDLRARAVFLYLMVVFRSVLLPLQAVVMNLLATGASFGLVAWVFERGTVEAVRLHQYGFVQVYLPLSVFALLFGLSMDYEVFLIRRIQEEWSRSQDTRTRSLTAWRNRASHRGGRRDHGRGVRLLRPRRRAGAQAVRHRAGGRGGARRDARSACW